MYILNKRPQYMGSWFSDFLKKPLQNWKFPLAVVGGLTVGGAAGLLPTTGNFGFLGQAGQGLWGGLKSVGSFLFEGGTTTAGSSATSGTYAKTGEGLLTGVWSGIKSVGAALLPSPGQIATGTVAEFQRRTQPQEAYQQTQQIPLGGYTPIVVIGAGVVILLLLLTGRR